jgi:hypothetical protein
MRILQFLTLLAVIILGFAAFASSSDVGSELIVEPDELDERFFKLAIKEIPPDGLVVNLEILAAHPGLYKPNRVRLILKDELWCCLLGDTTDVGMSYEVHIKRSMADRASLTYSWLSHSDHRSHTTFVVRKFLDAKE